ncbi:MAG: T9SS C-terminal target domain-containing protein [Bacteroidetes bacterium]|nr:MAG: T9SS C-terminal target domain-containing protein [Bacteroidota bacterium]
MKASLFLVPFLFIFQISLAQFSISADSIYVDVDAGEHYGTVDIQNDSIAGNILWIITTECEPENWTHYVMDIYIAYIPVVDSMGFELGANEQGFLSVFLLLPELPGQAKYTMEIWEEGDRENGKFVRFFFNGTDCEVTATEEQVHSEMSKVYPNPFSKSIFIDAKVNGNIEIIDVLGQLVYEKWNVQKGENEFFLPDLAHGYYLMVVRGENGKVVQQIPIVKY